MRRALALLALIAVPVSAQSLVPQPAMVLSETVNDVSVTVYRDPNRANDAPLQREFLNGFALISETRTLDLPAGESTIRFAGVAEGMVAVSAIVTGLPGGVVQKNRDAALLSPASLVDGSLGNRVTIRRNNPATGRETSSEAIIRTRADGGIVLQTADGFEAVRCAGLPEGLIFDRVPAGLTATPVLSVNTASPKAQRVTVTLTYLASGFDWEANYVARLSDDGKTLSLLGWLTLANENGQSFDNAQLLAIAGTLNVVSDYKGLAQAPEAEPIRLACYPIGSTAEGIDLARYAPPPPPSPPPPPPMSAPMMARAVSADEAVVVSGSRIKAAAQLEALGDLKLYRVPERATVAANGLKQVALLVKDAVRFSTVYMLPDSQIGSCVTTPLEIELRTTNDERNGLGLPLPAGGIALFRDSERGELLVGEASLSNNAVRQDIELRVAASPSVQLQCSDLPQQRNQQARRLALTNANPYPVRAEIRLTQVAAGAIRRASSRTGRRKGWHVWEVSVPANASRELTYRISPIEE